MKHQNNNENEVVTSNSDVENKTGRELKISEEIYRRLFETARDGILILDSETGAIDDVNPFLIQLLGYSKEEFLGKKLWEVGVFKNTQASKEIFKIVQETGYARYDNLPLEANDGRIIEVEFISNAYIAGDTRVIQCNVRDISERKRIEIADRAIALLEQEKLKIRFIADATHELRTPLAIIKGNVELALRDKNIKNVHVETFQAINVEVTHLAELLSDLTMLTTENQNIQSKISKSKVKLQDLISFTIERCAAIAKDKHITLEIVDVPDVTLIGDGVYLEKLFSNIVNNAIYYGKDYGTVSVSATIEKKYVHITITDNGIGISKEDIPHIFDRFYRANNAKSINREGTGLGLAISKWIVEAHNGTIEVQSIFGESTSFTIVLPCA